MKSKSLSYLLVLAIALSFSAVGCRKGPTRITKLPSQRVGGGSEVPDAPPYDSGSSLEGVPLPDIRDLESNYNFNYDRFAQQTVYFDFDSSVVKSSEQGKVEAVAAEMRNAGSNKLLIEGHCDERGTEEYNRALGERRALAVREALMGKGVDSSTVVTRSFGEDQPAALGHDESAWRLNRRGVFVFLTPK